MTLPNKDFWYTLRCFVVKIALSILVLAAVIGVIVGLGEIISHASKSLQHIALTFFDILYIGFIVTVLGTVCMTVWESCREAVQQKNNDAWFTESM